MAGDLSTILTNSATVLPSIFDSIGIDPSSPANVAAAAAREAANLTVSITAVNVTPVTNATVNASVDVVGNAMVNATGGFMATVFGGGSMTMLGVIVGVIVLAVVIVKAINKLMPVTKFIYANARIQARSNFLIPEQKMIELTEAKSTNEFVNSIKEYDVGEEVEAIPKKDDVKMLHGAIEQSFMRGLLELKKLSPKSAQPVLDAYIRFFEGRMLRVVYRAKRSNQAVDKDLLYPIGEIDDVMIKHLIEAQTTADMGVVLGNTIYKDAFSKSYTDLESFEVALDEIVVENFVKVVHKIKMHEGHAIIDMMLQRVDILNILALLRMRIRKIEPEKQESLIIHAKTELSKRINALVKAKNMDEFVSECKGTVYYDTLVKANEEYKKDNRMFHFEHKLWQYYKKWVIDKDLSHVLGPYPLFSYLVKKEFEQKNLFAISTGIDAKMPAADIKGLVI